MTAMIHMASGLLRISLRMEIRWRIGAAPAGRIAYGGEEERMLGDPTEHAGYLVVEAMVQQLAGVGVTLLRQEKFSVGRWM
jgi:hypothetical protein